MQGRASCQARVLNARFWCGRVVGVEGAVCGVSGGGRLARLILAAALNLVPLRSFTRAWCIE
jgi:hypothetical protein